MQDGAMIEWNYGNERPLRQLFGEKLAHLQEVASRGLVYAETNNAFIKGFGHLIAEALDHSLVAVIQLRRPTGEICDSLKARNYNPLAETREKGIGWMLHPTMTRNLTAYAGGDPRRWYAEEVLARSANFQERYPKLTYVTAWLNELNTESGVTRVFSELGLTALPSLTGVIGVKTNTRNL